MSKHRRTAPRPRFRPVLEQLERIESPTSLSGLANAIPIAVAGFSVVQRRNGTGGYGTHLAPV